MAFCAQGTAQSWDTYMGGDGMTELQAKEYSQKQNAW